jgi:uncharacterized CHY-type Zn-finger protein
MQIIIKGNLVDDNSRCVHYHSAEDIIAIQFKCCNQFYACIFCHNENETHLPEVWKKEEHENEAVLCGNCKTTMSIKDYLNCENSCIVCNSLFNPKCVNHHHFYFE